MSPPPPRGDPGPTSDSRVGESIYQIQHQVKRRVRDKLNLLRAYQSAEVPALHCKQYTQLLKLHWVLLTVVLHRNTGRAQPHPEHLIFLRQSTGVLRVLKPSRTTCQDVLAGKFGSALPAVAH